MSGGHWYCSEAFRRLLFPLPPSFLSCLDLLRLGAGLSAHIKRFRPNCLRLFHPTLPFPARALPRLTCAPCVQVPAHKVSTRVPTRCLLFASSVLSVEGVVPLRRRPRRLFHCDRLADVLCTRFAFYGVVRGVPAHDVNPPTDRATCFSPVTVLWRCWHRNERNMRLKKKEKNTQSLSCAADRSIRLWVER